MIKNKVIEIPTKTEEVVDFVQCELCEHRTKDTSSYEGTSNWAEDAPNGIEDITISYKYGYGGSDGGCTTLHIFDICPDCFWSKVVPALEALGAHARHETVDW